MAKKAVAKSAQKSTQKSVQKSAQKSAQKPEKKLAQKTSKKMEKSENTDLIKKPKKLKESLHSKTPIVQKTESMDSSQMTEEQKKWYGYYTQYGAGSAEKYTISKQFEAHKPLEHPLFGWGYILSNEYDRLEVLFKDGKKTLISNRKMN